MCAHNRKHPGVGVTCVTHLTTPPPPFFIMDHVSVLVTNLFGNHLCNVLQTTTHMSSQSSISSGAFIQVANTIEPTTSR